MVAGVSPSPEPENPYGVKPLERCAMPDPAYKHISATMVDDVVVVEINTKKVQVPAQAQELGAELSRVLGAFRTRKVLLDFTGVSYLGSVALAALSKTVKNVRSAGGQIKFCNMEPTVRSAAEIIFGADVVGSQEAVEIHDSRVRALVSFAMS
jgi:anti-anti-sigma factor